MEARSLARCLHWRPTSSLLYTRQPTLFRGQFITGQTALRYSSSVNTPPPSSKKQVKLSSTPTTQSKAPKNSPQSTTSGSSDFDRILDKLDLNNRDAAQASTSDLPQEVSRESLTSRPAPFSDPLSLSRAVSMAARTEHHTEHMNKNVRRVQLKLGPTLGRQVHVEPERGVDLAAALRSLQISIATNRVRAQSNAQKFHIRRGQMRKNVRMDRWKRLFKFSFDKTVSKIQRMRAQGW